MTRTYEIAVNHMKRVISCTSGLPGNTADITMSRNDEFVWRLCSDPTFTEASFRLRTPTGMRFVRGLYVLSDNGYPRHPAFQMPVRFSTSVSERAYSERVESCRKDVEGFFGILKVQMLTWKCCSIGDFDLSSIIHCTARLDVLFLCVRSN
jgi:hypothetical protein